MVDFDSEEFAQELEIKKEKRRIVCVRVPEEHLNQIKERKLCPSVLIRALIKVYLSGKPLQKMEE